MRTAPLGKSFLLLLFSCWVVSDSFATPWTVAHQSPLSMRFPRQDYWSGLSFPWPGHLPNRGIKPASPALGGTFFKNQEPPGKTPGNLWIPWIFSSLPELPATFPGSQCGTPSRADHVSTHFCVDRVRPGLGQIPWPISGECIQERKVAGLFCCCPCCFCPSQTSLSSPCPCPFLSWGHGVPPTPLK